MFRAVFFGLAMACLLTGACVAGAPLPTAEIKVADAERAFAASMAMRDAKAFADFVADDAVFLPTDPPLRGKMQIVAFWKRWFEGKTAPVSWTPERVVVLTSGTLALSRGPVFDATGKRIGSFTSIWRQDGTGRWRIVFDQGGN